jgi:hypothetical protein
MIELEYTLKKDHILWAHNPILHIEIIKRVQPIKLQLLST